MPLLTVFTKPWPKLSIPELAAFIKSLGLDGIELPVRPNFQVTPDTIKTQLPAAAKIFADHGLKILSIATTPNQTTIEAAAAAGVPIIRTMLPIDLKIGFAKTIANFHKHCESLLPLLEKNHVTLGLQNHCDIELTSAAALLHALAPFNPKHIAAILDVAHSTLEGEPIELAIDTVYDRLCMVNLKNYFKLRTNPAAQDAEATWETQWVPAKEGLASWSKTISILKSRNSTHPLCLTAEYTNHENVNDYIKSDVQYARQLLH